MDCIARRGNGGKKGKMIISLGEKGSGADRLKSSTSLTITGLSLKYKVLEPGILHQRGRGMVEKSPRRYGNNGRKSGLAPAPVQRLEPARGVSDWMATPNSLRALEGKNGKCWRIVEEARLEY